MIKLSKKGDYAIKTIVFLLNNKEKQKIEDIARETKIPVSLLRRIIADLEKSSVIKTIKGRNGGILLSENYSKFSLYDILKASGEELGISACSSGKICENVNNCNTTNLYSDIQKSINGILKLYTLDKIK